MKKLLLLSVLTLTACGGSGGSGSKDNSSSATTNNSSSAANGIPSNFVGVWDNSTDEGVDGYDEVYIAISANGKISVYDYAGDTFDGWGNCYWIAENSSQLTPKGGTKYLSTYTSPNGTSESEEVDISVSGNSLTVSSKDTDDADDDGNTTELYVETLTRSNRTVASFTPKCSDSFAAARAQIPAKQPKASSLR